MLHVPHLEIWQSPPQTLDTVFGIPQTAHGTAAAPKQIGCPHISAIPLEADYTLHPLSQHML
jgi:hypothetical protein